jgi:hypothetical protein
MNSSKSRRSIKYSVAGLIIALAAAFQAGLMTGAGHGWGSAVWCVWGAITFPMIGASIPFRNLTAGIVILTSGLIATLVIDAAIVVATIEEGPNYMIKTFNRLPVLFIGWLLTWTFPQLFAIGLISQQLLYVRKTS